MSTADARWVLSQAVAKLPAGRVLFIDADGVAADIVRERPDIRPVTFSTRRQNWLEECPADLAGVCMGWNPAKSLTRMLLRMLAEQVGAGTKLWLFGAGRSGISSAPSLLNEHWMKVEKVAYGGHAELWHAVLRESAPAHGLAAWEERSLTHVAGQDVVLVSLPGVFSHGEVDDGTRLLLEHTPLLPKGARVHDFGCGCGIIAAWLKLRQPDLVVSASDVSALAYAATKTTLRENKISGVTVHVAAGLAAIPGPLDVIVSNPPFHSGQNTDYSITEELFSSAAKKLAPRGALYIVGNRFLPYRAPMEKCIGPTQVLADTRSFWVLKATRG